MAMGTVQGCHLLLSALVKKIALFHETRLLHVRGDTGYGNMKVEVRNRMARKKKVKRFRAVQAVKELARERMGAPPAEKVVPHKNKKQEKHKSTLGKLLGEGE
ncbi:MAG: hypothetical protein WA671_14170, partial [Candidatus Sulfotelmatobacter sp.]